MRASDLLVKVPWLAGLGRGSLGRIAERFAVVRLPTGDPLWRQGAGTGDLAILVEGELTVHVDGGQVGVIRSGELVGEAAAFFRGVQRSATVKARHFAVCLTLPVTELARLRAEGSPVYEAILGEAIQTLARRVRATSRRISAASSGELSRPGRKPGVFARMWRSLAGAPSGKAPDLAKLLRRQPGMGHVGDQDLAQIASRWQAVPVREGQVIVLEGDDGDAAYIVADGEVDVLRNVRGDKASRLTTLLAGDTFGINALIDPGPRTASCVAVSPTWVYRLEPRAFDELQGAAGVVWRESMLACLATQIRSSNLALTQALDLRPAGGRRGQSPEAFQQLLRAQGMIAGLSLGEESVDVRM